MELQALLGLMHMIGGDYVPPSGILLIINTIALFTRHLCTIVTLILGLLPPYSMSLYCLGKNPGIHSIGICGVVRCIIAKAALLVVREDIWKAAGSRQLCVVQVAGQ